jgi:hypothetical protein
MACDCLKAFVAKGEGPMRERSNSRQIRREASSARTAKPDAKLALSTGDGFMPLRALSNYSGLSVRTLRDHLFNRLRPLPHYRIGGRIVVKRSEFDEWATQFRIAGEPVSLDELVDDVLDGLD